MSDTTAPDTTTVPNALSSGASPDAAPESPADSSDGAACCAEASCCAVAEPEAETKAMSRRALMVAGVNAVTAALLGIPVMGYLLGPILRRAQMRKVRVGPLSAYSETEPKRVRITYEEPGVKPSQVTRNVWVSLENGAPVVFSSVCTHLGCNVTWKPSEKPSDGSYFCPCHGGKFSPKGEVLGGPPPEPLERLSSYVQNGAVFVNV